MKPGILPYAQSLRVIGQALEVLRISSFQLEKKDEKYVIRDWEPSFLRSNSGKIWRRGDSKQILLIPRARGSALVYTAADANRLEAQGRLRRGLNDIRHAHDVSLGLRVVGDYLDRKGALAFNILWSIESVTVEYDTHDGGQRDERFTVQNLHDLGVGMYLRRSDRRAAK